MNLDRQILQEARRQLEWSQMEAAAQLGVSLVTYQRWEQGRTQPQPYHRRKLRSIFGLALCTPDELQANNTSPGNISSLSTLPTPVATPEETAGTPVDEPQVFIASHMITRLWSFAFMEYPTCDDKWNVLQQAIKEFDTMNDANKNYQITRREALCSLATLPMITLGLSAPGKSIQPAQYGNFLAHCTASLEGCWELSKSNEASDLTLPSSPFRPIFQCSKQLRETHHSIDRKHSLLLHVMLSS